MFFPTLPTIKQLFEEQIQQRFGGQIVESIIVDDCLMARAKYQSSDEVRVGDQVNAGCAIRVVEEQVTVHSFTYRKVCSNGAIAPNVVNQGRTCRLTEDEQWKSNYCLEEIERHIDEMSHPIKFQQTVEQMRLMSHHDVTPTMHVVLDLLGDNGFLTNMREHRQLIVSIARQLMTREEPSLFGLMNAVTAVARDTEDPHLRWDLEELGGGIGARLLPVDHPDSSGVLV